MTLTLLYRSGGGYIGNGSVLGCFEEAELYLYLMINGISAKMLRADIETFIFLYLETWK